MQNNSMPTGSVIEPASQQPFTPSAPGATPLNTGASLASAGSPLAAPYEEKKRARGTLIETILLILVSIIAIVFIFLFIQKYIEWDAVSTDVDGQITRAIAVATEETATKMEDEFAEREKYPYEQFTGPIDYGSFSFEYPKTWSVYVAKDAANGGDYEAYFNPKEVFNPSNNSTINALRFRIRDTSFDSAAKNYESSIKNGKLTLETRNVGGVLANVYTGEISSNRRGAIMLLKLRDKTVMLQTDAEIFIDDFYRLLDTVSLNE